MFPELIVADLAEIVNTAREDFLEECGVVHSEIHPSSAVLSCQVPIWCNWYPTRSQWNILHRHTSMLSTCLDVLLGQSAITSCSETCSSFRHALCVCLITV